MKKFQSYIKGHLDIKVIEESDEYEGNIESWFEILIHGDPQGLRSLADIIIKIADLNQNAKSDLPIGAREHIHLRPGLDLSKNSNEVIVGRIDAKGTEEFYSNYIPRDK
jgi:hypothetical protein